MKKKNLRKGFTIIELVMVIGIVGLLTTFTTIKYQKAKEINDIKMLETRIITTINNASISLTTMRDFEPKYMKFYQKGIVIAKGYNNSENIYEIEYESGMNRGNLQKTGMSMTLDCDDNRGIPCPILIFRDETSGIPIEPLRESGLEIPQNLDNKNDSDHSEIYEDNRKLKRYVKISDGKVERPFTVVLYNKNGNVKSKIDFTGNKFLQIEIYDYIGSTLNKIGSDISDYQVETDWKKRRINNILE
ncbi:MAG: type II secretion system protein [Fusobacteriaceae bacterium]